MSKEKKYQHRSENRNHIYVRVNSETYEAFFRTKEKTGLSINSLACLCLIKQLDNLPDFKVDKIEVYFTDEEGKKKVSYSGNTLTKKSNLKHKGD